MFVVYIKKSSKLQTNLLLHDPYKHNNIITVNQQWSIFSSTFCYNWPSIFEATNFLKNLNLSDEPTIILDEFNLHLSY